MCTYGVPKFGFKKGVIMSDWTTVSGSNGLRYREHPTKTIGVGRTKRPLRYYMAYYRLGTGFQTDVYGWENEINGGIAKIESLVLLYRMNRKAGIRPFTHSEMIESVNAQIEAENQVKEEQIAYNMQQEQTLFSTMFQEYCDANSDKVSLKDEMGYYKNWIEPAIGHMQLDDIKLRDLDQIAKAMRAAGRAPRTIGYIKSIIRQVYNHAVAHELFSKNLPTTEFLKKQVLNNKRDNYLSPEDVGRLLAELRKHSEKVYRMTLLSVNTGMRFGEIARLLWQHIDIKNGTIHIMDPKNKSNRIAYMNSILVEMFEDMEHTGRSKRVFPSIKGTRMKAVSDTFREAVNTLGFNDGVTDRRRKIVFHSLRHTCASWLANNGEEMQIIGRVLGHKSMVSTMRYSHINDSSAKSAVQSLTKLSSVVTPA
jgi:integrase